MTPYMLNKHLVEENVPYPINNNTRFAPPYKCVKVTIEIIPYAVLDLYIGSVWAENKSPSFAQSYSSSKQHCGIKTRTVMLAIGPVISYKTSFTITLFQSGAVGGSLFSKLKGLPVIANKQVLLHSRQEVIIFDNTEESPKFPAY